MASAVSRVLVQGLVLGSLSMLGAATTAAQTVLYATDFEAPAITLGPLGGTLGVPGSEQDGWSVLPREPYSAAPSPWVTVVDSLAHSGHQSVQMRVDNSFFNGVNGFGPSMARDFSSQPLGTNSPTDPLRISFSLYIDQAANSDLTWSLSLLSNGAVKSMAMTIMPGGTQVRYAHTNMNQPAFYTPGFNMLNTWLDLTMETDPSDASLLRIGVSDGTTQWFTQVGTPGSPMSFVVISGGLPSFPSAISRGSAYVDDVLIGYDLPAVPEPGTAALVLAGGALLRARRRRVRA